MSLKTISLKKLLQFCGADQRKLISELRKDIGQDIKKQQGTTGGGGDFHMPFWSDAKKHAFLGQDLTIATKIRIESHKGRRRLYNPLRDGFLEWWDKERLTTNEKIGELEANVHAHFEIPKFDMILKVVNLMCMQVGADMSKAVYPYFPEVPALKSKWARVGLWLMEQALEDFELSEIKILDVLRAREFSKTSHPLKGNEKDLFEERFSAVTKQWENLILDYPHYEQ